MAKRKSAGVEPVEEVVIEEDSVEEAAEEPVKAPVEKTEEKKSKKKAVAPAGRNLDDLLPSQMTREEMLQFCKDKGVELPAAASNVDIRKAIRIHLDNGKKVGPTL